MMKYVTRVTFCLGLFVLVAGASPTYAVVSLSGRGGIDFEGTGTITHMQQTPVFEVFGLPCTEHNGPDFRRTCSPPLDMSLLGNDIVRAEHLRVNITFISNIGGFSLVFGCSTCGSSVFVGIREMSESTDGRLPPAKEAALQSLIDQFGANTIRMAVSRDGISGSISSSVRAVGLDIKPNGFPNSFNPRSRGMIGIAILTTQFFNASSVDVTSLRFGATGAEATPHHAVLDDVDDDGDADLLVFFRRQDTEIDCDTLFTYFSGETLTGQAIAGTDSVAVVGCH